MRPQTGIMNELLVFVSPQILDSYDMYLSDVRGARGTMETVALSGS